MNKVKIFSALFLALAALISCNRDDDNNSAPIRDYGEQYTADILAIETYLKTHTLTVTTIDGQPDVSITAIPTGNPDNLISIWDNTAYPLQSKIVQNDNRTSNAVDGELVDDTQYKLYYLTINTGGGATAKSIDSTYVSYRGWKLDNAEFDRNANGLWFTYPPVTSAETNAVSISGFRQILSGMNASTGIINNPDGTFSFQNSGVAVAFLPSGLAYFSAARTGIPAYSPLVFTIRLHTIRERDHDRDGVLTKYEDLNNDGNPFNDDTDGDNTPDFFDIDDDGDRVQTRFEVRDENNIRYPFELIPTCPGGTQKRHLDPNCN
ncbi:hypothetical protein [Flavobacterium sp.]|uniref:FKBP-type peptidyl-prolyl cis-trans isomerase n=1 Tax=Flavobacterium sp. TaxID=239 RepID=UPI00262B77CA|nr:hypothetical protein [Flavobacterium sp.]